MLHYDVNIAIRTKSDVAYVRFVIVSRTVSQWNVSSWML